MGMDVLRFNSIQQGARLTVGRFDDLNKAVVDRTDMDFRLGEGLSSSAWPVHDLLDFRPVFILASELFESILRPLIQDTAQHHRGHLTDKTSGTITDFTGIMISNGHPKGTLQLAFLSTSLVYPIRSPSTPLMQLSLRRAQ